MSGDYIGTRYLKLVPRLRLYLKLTQMNDSAVSVMNDLRISKD